VLHEEVSRRGYEEEGVDPIEQAAVAGEQVSRILHVGLVRLRVRVRVRVRVRARVRARARARARANRALEQRDGEVSNERHHGAHDSVERAREQRHGPAHEARTDDHHGYAAGDARDQPLPPGY
jgi:hypothetical protein